MAPSILCRTIAPPSKLPGPVEPQPRPEVPPPRPDEAIVCPNCLQPLWWYGWPSVPAAIPLMSLSVSLSVPPAASSRGPRDTIGASPSTLRGGGVAARGDERRGGAPLVGLRATLCSARPVGALGTAAAARRDKHYVFCMHEAGLCSQPLTRLGDVYRQAGTSHAVPRASAHIRYCLISTFVRTDKRLRVCDPRHLMSTRRENSGGR
eukprot:5894382-Pleurochrysis_carterae.AAC.1